MKEEPQTIVRRMYVERPVPVHSYDVDFMQIVNNTVYVKWFEDLRMAILDEYLPLTDMLKEGNSPILSETHVKYRHPVTFDCHPTGRAWMEDLQKSRWTIRLEIFEGDKIYCEGLQKGYYYNMASRRPVRFPEHLLREFAEGGMDEPRRKQ